MIKYQSKIDIYRKLTRWHRRD